MADLEQILVEHRRWIETAGREGAQANLEDMDLTAADLKGAELSEARLNRANLKGADLTGIHLRGASLAKACLEDTHLELAELRDANLSDASLVGASGMLSGQIAGANVSGARLPEAIHKFDAFSVVVDGSKSFTTLMLSVLAAVAYALLTIGSTRDAHLLANSGQTQLPVIGTPTPIVQFFWLGPALLLGLYFYYLVTAQRLWELVAEMPAVFPDGRTLDKKLNSLLLSALLHAHFPQLRGRRPPLSWLQEKFSIVISWWLIPATLLVFWARYLRRHDWAGTTWHILIVTVAVAAGVGFYRLAVVTLAGNEEMLVMYRHPLRHLRVWRSLTPALVVGALLAFFSLGAIDGVPAAGLHGSEAHDNGRWDPRRWLPRLYEGLDIDPEADLQGAELSQKPADWTDGAPGALRRIKGAHLRYRQLNHARATGAFFVNSDMRGAQLEGATLFTADLRLADLRGADLTYADLEKARLDEAELAGAALDKADLAGATLVGADLKTATLTYADLERAVLTDSRLVQADLTNANLLMADFKGADLTGAKLDGAHMEGADLRGALGLTQAQLEPAHTNSQTQVPAGWVVDEGPEQMPGKRWRH